LEKILLVMLKQFRALANPIKKSDGDKRREEDADWGVKKYHGIDENGKAWEKIKSWFGFRLHLIVDAEAELPIAYTVTKASMREQPVMDELFVELEKVHPELIERCEHAMFDVSFGFEHHHIKVLRK
jgi:hypothetical protein